MDKELMEMIDARMTTLERFRFDRKRIVAAALAEAANELPNDGYYDVLANHIISGLKHKEILRRGQESWAMRNLVDRIFRLAGEEDLSFSAIVDPVTKPGSGEKRELPGTDQSQHDRDNEPV